MAHKGSFLLPFFILTAVALLFTMQNSQFSVLTGTCPYDGSGGGSMPEGYVALTGQIPITGSSLANNACQGGSSTIGDYGFTCDYPACKVSYLSDANSPLITLKGTAVSVEGSGWFYVGYGLNTTQLNIEQPIILIEEPSIIDIILGREPQSNLTIETQQPSTQETTPSQPKISIFDKLVFFIDDLIMLLFGWL